MLSPQTLNRMPDQFRRGYRDGYEGRDPTPPVVDGTPGLFSNFDYNGGHSAGANDRKWDDHYRTNGYGKAATSA